MSANSKILTTEASNYEIRQFFYAPKTLLPPDNSLLHGLYGFVSYHPEWAETLFSSNVKQTIITSDVSIFKSSNTLSVINAPSLDNFRVNQKIDSTIFPENTIITSIDEDNYLLHLNNTANSSYIGSMRFVGFIENDNKITLNDEKGLMDNIDINNCLVVVDVTNEGGGLVYRKNIVDYDVTTKTITVDSAFNDSPSISESSTISLVYDDKHPPLPKNNVKYKKMIHKNMIFMKKISPNDMAPVIKRINWESGTVYDYYNDDVDMSEKHPDGTPKHSFYAMNQYYQVFKCLWNNGGNASLIEPYFVAGNFDDTNNIFYDPDDGYKWKYMYTIPYASLQKFFDVDWIPLTTNGIVDIKESLVKEGGIDVINILDGGKDYNKSNAIVDVVISGDGYGASAYVVVDDNKKTITDVVVTSSGYGYTYADISIVSAEGSDAKAVASVSPIGGTGSNIMSELYCDRIMITCPFTGIEDGRLPTELGVRQIGLIVNPSANSSYPYIASSEAYSTTTDVIISNGFGAFADGEIIYQSKNSANIADSIFTAICVKYDPASNLLRLTNVHGNAMTGLPLYGYSTGTSRSLLRVSYPDIIKYSGDIIYIENRETIHRSPDGTELMRIVLKF